MLSKVINVINWNYERYKLFILHKKEYCNGDSLNLIELLILQNVIRLNVSLFAMKYSSIKNHLP